MSKLLKVFEFCRIGQSFVSSNKIEPPTLDLVFLTLKLLHIDFVRVVLFTESSISFSYLLRVKSSIVFDVQQLIWVVLTCELYILLNNLSSADCPLCYQHADRYFQYKAFLASQSALRR